MDKDSLTDQGAKTFLPQDSIQTIARTLIWFNQVHRVIEQERLVLSGLKLDLHLVQSTQQNYR
jgi:hypothetical protein